MIKNRFVTAGKILTAAREKAINTRRSQGYRGPLGAIQLDTEDVIKAFLDYFDKLGEEGWNYKGMAEYPDLPYGCVYVFQMEVQGKKSTTPIKRVEEKVIDEKPITYEEKEEEKEDRKDEVEVDITSDNATTETVTDNTKVDYTAYNSTADMGDIDLDSTDGDITDKLEKLDAKRVAEPIKETHVLREEFHKQYKKETGKEAEYKGKETKIFKSWLDQQKAKYDPYYKQYEVETGKCALESEEETTDFKSWLVEYRKKGVVPQVAK